MYKRVIIKISGEALSGDGSASFDDNVVSRIACEVKTVLESGTEVALVVGGGNFWRGAKSSDALDRAKSDQIGMLATVMNAIYLSEAFRRIGVEAVVMTPFVAGAFTTYFSKEEALRLMAAGKVVINAGGLGHPYFSTDTITALRGAELHCDVVLYAKNINGVYDMDPKKFTSAKRLKTVSYEKIIKDNLNATDIAAINISREAKMPSFLFGLEQPGSIVTACGGGEQSFEIGTKADINIEEEYYV